MKTHAIKENRILKSFDFALIVLSMSIVTFTISKSPVFFPGLFGHSVTSSSLKAEFPTVYKEKAAAMNENPTAGTVALKSGIGKNALNNAKAEQAAVNLITIMGYLEPVAEDGLQLEEWMVDQSQWLPAAFEISDNASGTETGMQQNTPVFTTGVSLMTSPEMIAVYLAETKDPVTALEPWMTDQTVWDSPTVAGVEEISTSAVGSSECESFDAQAYLVKMAKVNEALAPEEETPLKMEPWMLDDDCFTTQLSSTGKAMENKKIKALRFNRKAAF